MREPHFWKSGLDPKSRESAPLTRALLTPLAFLYRTITALKIANTTPTKTSAKVICVGNITAGGVGKSPIVSALRSRIAADYGLRTATLSRGYGGSLRGPVRVDPDKHLAAQVGDEPLMLSQKGESWIGTDRAAAGQQMSAAGVDVIIMDDGHQNPKLAKDFTFVVIDSEAPFGNGHIIPKGPLREPIVTSLKRADAVIMMGNGQIPNVVQAQGLPILAASVSPSGELPCQPYVAFAGIGRPVKFFDTLADIKADVRDSVPFPDHHTYSNTDMDYLHQLARDRGAKLVTTEKDFARLTPSQRADVLTLPIQIRFDDTALLDKLLSDVLKDTAK